MRHFVSISGGLSSGARSASVRSEVLAGRLVYLAGPRTCLDPEGYALLEASLLDLGVVDAAVELAFPAAAHALRAHGASVTCPFESPWWRGSDHSLHNVRAERDRDAAALEAADLVVVLDGWQDVPGAVDTAILVAETRGVPWGRASEVLAESRAAATATAAPLRRRASLPRSGRTQRG